jgi:nuclear migration protein JNM1
VFTHPPSPTSPTSSAPAKPLSVRLNTHRGEIDVLESEISDPSNPLLQTDDVNPGELMRGLLDVRARLEKIGLQKEGRGRMVELVVSDGQPPRTPTARPPTSPRSKVVRDDAGMGEMDRRVKELETLLGSSAATLDDVLSFSLVYCSRSSVY